MINYYMTNFTIMWDLKRNISEWDDFMPFEKQIYLDLMMGRLEEESKKNNNNKNSLPGEADFEREKIFYEN